MRVVGLAMTMNEEDIVEESFSVHCRHYDEIVVMDNSVDRTPEILRQFPQVKKIFNQKDIFGNQRVWDGMRGVPFRYILDELGADWVSLVHADEIPIDNPIKAVEMASYDGAECIWWKFAQFYFHVSEERSAEFENPDALSVQARRLWYAVNWAEPRQYKVKPGLYYDHNKNSHTVPHGVIVKNRLEATPLLKHYTFRSLDQSRLRVQERKDLQPYYRNSEGRNLFKRICPHGIELKKYSGSFGIYENSLAPPGIRGEGWNYYNQQEFKYGAILIGARR